MKKQIFILTILLCSIVHTIIAQSNYRDFEFTIDTSEYKFTSSNDYLDVAGEGWIEPNITMINDGSSCILGRSNIPAIPYKGASIILPYRKLIDSCVLMLHDVYTWKDNITISSSSVDSGYLNVPCRGLLRKTYPDAIYPLIKDKILFANDVFKELPTAGFAFSPFIYDSYQKKLKIASSVTVRVYYKEGVLSNFKMEELDKNAMALDNVLNPEDLDEYPNQPQAIRDPICQYLIITNNRLKETFQQLADWKIVKGIKTEVVTVEDIWANDISTDSPQLKIKKFIKQRYLESNKTLKWVLLGGDDTVIPVQNCYIYYKFDKYPEEDCHHSIPTDMYYACLHGNLSWNANKDYKIGEYEKFNKGDNVSLDQDVYIARMPVDNSTDATTIINKTINYEKGIIGTDVSKNLFCAVKISSAGTMSDAHRDMEEGISMIDCRPRFPITRFYDTYTDFEGGAAYDVTADHLKGQLNKGYHIWHVHTHGSSNAFAMENGRVFTTKDVMELTNIHSPNIILSQSCDVNGFDVGLKNGQSPCISEAFLTNPHNGNVAFYGNTRVSISGVYKPYVFFINEMFYNYKLAEEYQHSFGYLAYQAKYSFVNEYSRRLYGLQNMSDFEVFTFYTLNAMGDPELDIRTSNPLTFSSATVTKSGTTVTVKSGGVDNCRISLTSPDGGKSYFDVKIGSEAVFTNVTGPYTVSIVKHNYRPYVVKSMSLVGSAELTASLPTGSCSVNGLPSGATVTYTSAHPHLVTVTAGGNNTATLRYTPSNSAPTTHVDTITATVSHNGSTYTLTKSINLLGTEVDLSIAHQDVTWSGNKILNGTYRVYGGYTLTIDGALACTNNAKIYIERGGTLKLTGNAKIKTAPMSGVSGWQGIEAEYQSLTSMGYIDRDPAAELELLPGAVTNTLRYTDGAEIDSRQVCLYNVIKGHEEWQGQKKVIMPSGVTVVSGGCLNIGNDAEVLLKKGASIRVRQTADVKGGQLNIGTNAKLKPFKTGENWKGIDAGTGSILQFCSARLEGADCALSCSGQLEQIKIEQTTFTANRTALSLSDNTSYTASDPMQYVVTGCCFSNNMEHDVSLNRIKGAIRFSGNKHEGKNTSGFYDIRNSNGYTISGGTWNNIGAIAHCGIGLFLTNSSLNISGVTINNFNYGLRVQGSVGYELKVTSCTFKNNRRGLDFTTGKVTLQNNRFELPAHSTDLSNNEYYYGAVLSAVPLYTISNNTFIGTGNSELETGLAISSSGSGSETKAVKNNIFRNCYYGTVVNGMNRYSLYGGLVFTDNNFSGAYDAIRVVPSNNNNVDGIAYHQGEVGKPSGNVFANTSDNALNIMSGCASSIYCYDSNNSFVQKPKIRVSSTTTLVGTYIGPSGGPLAYSMNDKLVNDVQLTADEAVLQKVNARRARLEQLAPIVQQDSTAIALYELEKVIEEDPHDMLGIWAKAVLDTRQDIIGESAIYYEMPLASTPSFEARKARANWLRVSPNPAEEGVVQLHISSDVWEESAPERLTVTDIYGTIVWSEEVASGTTVIVLPQRLSSGTYTCTLWGSEGVVVQATALVR